MIDNYIYKYNEIKKEKYIKKQIEIYENTKFFYKSLNEKVKYFIDKEGDIEVIYLNFFDEVYFFVEIEEINEDIKTFTVKKLKDVNKELKMNNDYYSLYLTGDGLGLNEERISYLLRGSKSLNSTNYNCYDNTDVKVTFSENTFVCINKFNITNETTRKSQRDKFRRISILYLLAHVYNMYTERLIYDVSNSIENKEITKMLNLRDSIYIFDLKFFFNNPVNYRFHQLYAIWAYLQEIYSVEQNHKEMKSQVEDFVNIIEVRNRESEKQEREYVRAQEELKIEEERKQEKLRRDAEKQERENERIHEQLRREKEKEEREEERREEQIRKEKEKEEREIIRMSEEDKFNKKTKRLTQLAVAIALISLVSAYKDFDELGGVKYIKSLFNEKIEKVSKND